MVREAQSEFFRATPCSLDSYSIQTQHCSNGTIKLINSDYNQVFGLGFHSVKTIY